MSRKCQVAAYEAIAAGRPYHKGNDVVQQEGQLWTWRYHGKRIAERDGQRWRFMDAGWRNYTTKERLNLAMWGAFGASLYQKDGDWFIRWPDNKIEPWTGARSFTVP